MPDSIEGNPGRWFSFAIERQSEPGIIGEFAVHLLAEDERQAMFGFTIDASLQRQGYASEALRGVLDYLFEELHLHRVIAICDVENTASKAVLEKVGFRREAEFIENIFFKGAWGSEYQYAMLEREWQALRGLKESNHPQRSPSDLPGSRTITRARREITSPVPATGFSIRLAV